MTNNSNIKRISNSLSDLRSILKSHDLYKSLHSLGDVKIFMENHIFAVWDFMSLLKSLQRQLTCITVPWIPTGNPILTRFINEIVLGEECDFNELNEPKSHFEMYLEAMDQIDAKKEGIELLIKNIKLGADFEHSIKSLNIPNAVKSFIQYSFQIITTKQIHKIASAFTYGREDIIPDMFIAIINEVDPKNTRYPKLKYYFNRHIEIDGDLHGPLSHKMLIELCGDDQKKWDEVYLVGKNCLENRIKLWDAILDQIVKNNSIENHQNSLVNA
ncbi:MAG: heme oxygenase [bacterium TMED264]|nr:MAG: heme oxygenase [bacterium TMED264]